MIYRLQVDLDLPGPRIAGSELIKFLRSAIRTELILKQDGDNRFDMDLDRVHITVRQL